MKNTLEVREVTDKKAWEHFIISSEWSPFFQSWSFGEAQHKTGTQINRVGVFEGEKMIMAAQICLVRARRGTFLHLRHAPVFHDFDKNAFNALLNYVTAAAQKEHVLFIRMSPLLPDNTKECEFFKKKGFIAAPVHNQDAENCLILDLSPPLETIMNNFRKTTRYLVRKAEKDGVTVTQDSIDKHLEEFFELYRTTAKRDGFVAHRGIREEFEELKKENEIALFTAYYEAPRTNSHDTYTNDGAEISPKQERPSSTLKSRSPAKADEKKAVASSLVVFYGKQAVYHHSGSIPNKVGANYLLQWEIIKEAKKRGMKYYNFWGVAPENKPRHPWQGLSLFKQGFGGTRHNFLHAQDLPLSPLYWLSYWYQKFWNFRKGY